MAGKGKSRIIYIVIIVATVSTILVTWHFQKRIEESLPAIASVAAAGFIGSFTYYHQSRGEKKRNEMLYQINKISKNQERSNLALARGPLIRIGKDFEGLSRRLDEYLREVKENTQKERYNLNLLKECKNKLEPDFDDKLLKIYKRAQENHIFIGEIYYEILNAINDFGRVVNSIKDSYNDVELQNSQKIIKDWEDKCDKAIHEIKLLRDHIDYFFFLPLDPSEFKNVAFSNITQSNPIFKPSIIIIIGSKGGEDAKADREQAEDLKKEITAKFPRLKNQIKIKNDREVKVDEELLKNNLIIIGGSRINSITNELSSRFPMQYIQSTEPGNIIQDNIYSRISGEIYSGSKYVVAQIMKNPYRDDKKKSVIVAFGPDRSGTEYAVKSIIGIIRGNISEEKFKNLIETYYPAKVIRVVDDNKEDRLHKDDPLYYRIESQKKDGNKVTYTFTFEE
jgi:REP element-mobilizing transposase RayT